MKILKIIVGTYILISILMFDSCKEEPPKCNDPTNPNCENYDPCYEKNPVIADFEMSQKWFRSFPDYIGDWHPDVAFGRGLIGFKPVGYDEGDTSVRYTWLLGSEVIHDYYFERDFGDTKQSGEKNIPITLIIEKTPDLDCYPNDDGKDTMVRYIKLVDSYCEFLTFGDFKVLYEGDQDSVIIKIRNWKLLYYLSTGAPITDSCDGTWVNSINLDDKRMGDTVWNTAPIAIFNSKIWFAKSEKGGGYGQNYNGYFEVDPITWKCKGEFQVDRRPLTTIQRFSGRKLN